MTCVDYRDQAALAALDALDLKDQAAFESHVAACTECRAELDSLREVAGMIGYATPEVALSRNLKGRLMQRIEAETSLEKVVSIDRARERSQAPRKRQPLASWALAMGLVASVGLSMYLWSQVDAVRSQNARLARGLAHQSEQLAFLQDPSLKVIPVAGQGSLVKAQAKVLWSPAKRAWLFSVADLPPAAPHKTYQLWAVTGRAKVSLGTFQTDHQGESTLVASLPQAVDKPVAVAVSVEPAGGVPQPTGAIVLLGTI